MTRIAQPKPHEPIRLIETARGPRYRVVLDTAPKGTPRKQLTRTFDDLVAARRFVTETRVTLTNGSFTAPNKVTLTAVAEAWLADREAESQAPGGIREVSVNGYRSALSGPLLHLGDRPIQSISRADIRGLIRTLATDGGCRERGFSHRTIVYALGTLRQVFAYALEAGLIAKNPTTGVKPPKRKAGDKKPIHIWTRADLARFRAHIDGCTNPGEPWIRAAMRLTLCGLRRSEVLGLDWTNVDLDTGLIRIEQGRVKTGRGHATVRGDAKSDDSHRAVPVAAIHPGTKAALRDLWIAQGQPESGLVVIDINGDPIQPDAYSRKFRALSDAAGVPDLGSIHNVRHTVATALHDAGVQPRNAAALLGHKVTTHLAFYVPTTDTGAAEAAHVAGDLFAATNLLTRTTSY